MWEMNDISGTFIFHRDKNGKLRELAVNIQEINQQKFEDDDVAIKKVVKIVTGAPEMYNALVRVNGILQDPRITELLKWIDEEESEHE